MAGAYGSSNVSGKLSGDSATSLFDDVSTTTSISTSSPSIPQRLVGLHNDAYNGYQPSGTLLDGILQNLSIWDNEVDQTKYCTCCDGIQATSYCCVCQDYLCDKCVSAHGRVKVTREHPITRIDSMVSLD